ncbi:MAG: methyltransferase domain-containing protein [Cyclobacteriaceae bacterium]
MATKAVINFGIKNRALFKGPVLEIGSLIDPSYEQFLPREIHEDVNEPYVGIDIFDGEGVDHTINMCHDNEIPENWTSNGGYYETVHCHDVMEHVTDIFSMAKNIDRVVKVGGKLYISVPFVWKIHRIPIDMWRFTPQSIDYLFPNFEFKKNQCGISTRGDEFYPIDHMPELNLGSSIDKLNPFFKYSIKILRKLKLDNNFFKNRALLPEINLMMIGEKKNNATYSFMDAKLL